MIFHVLLSGLYLIHIHVCWGFNKHLLPNLPKGEMYPTRDTSLCLSVLGSIATAAASRRVFIVVYSTFTRTHGARQSITITENDSDRKTEHIYDQYHY